ncbi:superoxide dismutase [Candidatus Peregrinibacteria bacterium]|nr:superoxide dismutase [Candidatus Peregrinibacteria bacterium]
MQHTLPSLAYSFDVLEPYLDAKTMEIHYLKHHQTYCDKMNEVLTKYPELANENPEDLIKRIDVLPMDEKDKNVFRNFGGGFINHNLYWSIMGPKKEIDKVLTEEITKTFGSIEKFKKQFTACAASHFGSGWAWLVYNEKHELEIYSLPNQDSPFSKGHTPIITLDVWEHAYYLKYQNRRAEFIENWWNVLKMI